ncbi:DUF3466 family protein [Vibrio hangzhouensis]|uniref:GlyGly-CTERM domain-containing protein n=1 Tax=Vibrio hangzhouensis TaxID=462991 RepID=A0A1H5YD71_9VIBR|nr:DUF3466 family protein [Vibrio hangzhouensis]SEG21968.1 GlyGly-CTERM domain-containing protein [Vibrio hangzhouensis]
MSRINFKISLLAASVMAATSSQAALYKVVEVDPSSDMSANGIYDAQFTEFYGSAIEQTTRDLTAEPKGCFQQGTSCPAYILAGDSRNGSEGHSYRQEVPFNYDSSFYYTDWGRNRDYCRSELGYQTCDPAWTDKMWRSFSQYGGLQRERDAFLTSSQTGWGNQPGEDDYFSNALAFEELSASSDATSPSAGGRLMVSPTSDYKPAGVGAAELKSENVVINNLAENRAVLGNTSSGYYKTSAGNLATAYRHRGFVYDGNTTTMLLPLANDGTDAEKLITTQMGRTMAWGSFNDGSKTYFVGSAAVGPFDYNDDNKNWGGDLNNCLGKDDPAALRECQNFAFATKAAVWSDGNAIQASNWTNGTSRNVDKKAMQGSARAAVMSQVAGDMNGKPVLVGLNSFQDGSNVFMEATVFKPSTDGSTIEDGNYWSPVRISRSTVKSGDDFVYSNSVATDINNNLILIGEAKRRGDKRENGAAPNRMFLASVNPSSGAAEARYFDELNGNSGIFFRGVGGETGAINNFNEIVGAVDAEQSTEYFGKKRRQRGFIYPYNTAGTDADRFAIFQGKPWLLDDLTNDGNKGGNNQFRIVDAADINDDGVIAATALKCDGGYDTTGHNSYCGNGQQREKVVAVKLIPIANATSADIQPRGIEAPPVERKGGSLGWMALIFLGFFGLRRNK